MNFCFLTGWLDWFKDDRRFWVMPPPGNRAERRQRTRKRCKRTK